MTTLVAKIFAKSLVIPAVFSFAFSCCQPMFLQAAELDNTHSEGHLRQIITHTTESTIQEGHHCDHGEHGQSAVRAPTQKITANLVFVGVPSHSLFFYQHLPLNPAFVVRTRITGPPWSGKNIKGLLGVYRS